jgi:hypothetical protein
MSHKRSWSNIFTRYILNFFIFLTMLIHILNFFISLTMLIHIYGFLDFLSLCSSILCIVQSEIEDEVAKATENYINLEVADHIGLQQIIATASQSIKTKKRSTLVKILAIADPENGTEFFDEIKKHYDKNGDNVQMTLDRLHRLCQSQVDSKEKTNWLKLWNANDDTKHAASFPLEIGGNDALDPWLTRRTFWWQVFLSEIHYLICYIFMYQIYNIYVCLIYIL